MRRYSRFSGDDRVKICFGCKRDLTVDNFSSHCRSKDGLQPRCKGCNAISADKYRRLNRDKESVRHQEYRDSHRSELAEKFTLWSKNNKELKATIDKHWQKNNPDRRRAASSLYRARKLNASIGLLPDSPLQELIKIYGPKCIVPNCPRLSTTVDHIIALANGGPHSFDNMQPMCGPCNSSKGAHHSTDYRNRAIIKIT